MSEEPKLLALSNDIAGYDNFPCGCNFSPDGLCLLTWTASDSKLRIYNTTLPKVGGKVVEWKTALACHGGNAVRSFSWYPHMKSTDPATCCFVAAARNQPVHLYDAYTGVIRASYRPYNALDEMESATVACFHPSGTRVAVAGFRTDRTVHMFDTLLPGRESTILRLGKTRRSSDGQKGLVSSMSYSCDGKFLAVGTYSPGSIYVYDDRTSRQPTGTILEGVCVVGHGRSHARKKRRFVALNEAVNDTFDGDESPLNWVSSAKVKWFHSKAQRGVTQLQFAPNNEYTLYSVSRRSNAVLCWDLRILSDNPDLQSNPVGGIGSFDTCNDTNQRLGFDLNETGTSIFIGGNDCCVRMYNTAKRELTRTIVGLDGPANGVSSCPPTMLVPNATMLAVATGSRHFLAEEDLENDGAPMAQHPPPGFLRLFQLNHDGL